MDFPFEKRTYLNTQKVKPLKKQRLYFSICGAGGRPLYSVYLPKNQNIKKIGT